MKIEIELTEDDLRQLVLDHLATKLGDIPLTMEHVKIETKSKQNFRSEWETAAFRVRYMA